MPNIISLLSPVIISFRQYDENDILFFKQEKNRNNGFKPLSLSPVNQHTCNLIYFFWGKGEGRQIKKKSVFRKLAKFWKKKFSPSEVWFRHPFAAPLHPLLWKTFLQFAFVFGTPPLKNQRTTHFFAKFYWPNLLTF